MTEKEWLASTDPRDVLIPVLRKNKVSERKLRLILCGICRVHWWMFLNTTCRAAIGVAERFADGMASHAELQSARASVPGHLIRLSDKLAYATAEHRAYLGLSPQEQLRVQTAHYYVRCALVSNLEVPVGGEPEEKRTQCDVFRELCRNPFRPVAIDRSWLKHEARELAERVYRKGEFDRLRELGDVLERAGCTDREIQEHSRKPAPHIRGCWLVDLILQQS